MGLACEMRITSDPARLADVRSAVRSAAADVGFPDKAVEQIALAVDEALTNVIKHGYGGAGDQPIDIRVEPVADGQREGLRLVIRDYGKAVDPALICGRDLDDVRPGGLGVHFMKTIMDELCYEPADGGGTRLNMLKWK